MQENLFEYPVIIREQHLDSYGHVNNATYLQLAEEARWEMMHQLAGLDLFGLHEMGEGPVVLEIQIKFLKEIRLRERIKITFQMVEWLGKVGRMKQEFIRENGEVAATVELVFGLLDMKKRKLIPPTPFWSKVWKLDENQAASTAAPSQAE